MICATCFGPVEWKGPFSNLTHTECLDCGRINNQMVDEIEDAISDSADSAERIAESADSEGANG